MIKWPTYRVTFSTGRKVEVVSPALASAIVDALAIANADEAQEARSAASPEKALGEFDYRMTDVTAITQTGEIYISDAILASVVNVEGREDGGN